MFTVKCWGYIHDHKHTHSAQYFLYECMSFKCVCIIQFFVSLKKCQCVSKGKFLLKIKLLKFYVKNSVMARWRTHPISERCRWKSLHWWTERTNFTLTFWCQLKIFFWLLTTRQHHVFRISCMFLFVCQEVSLPVCLLCTERNKLNVSEAISQSHFRFDRASCLCWFSLWCHCGAQKERGTGWARKCLCSWSILNNLHPPQLETRRISQTPLQKMNHSDSAPD